MADSLHLTAVSLTVFHLTEINTLIVNRSGALLREHVRDPVPDFLLPLQQRIMARLIAETGPGRPGCSLYTNDWGLAYAAHALPLDNGAAALLVVGPFLKQIPDSGRLYADLRIDQDNGMLLEEWLRGLKLIGSSRLQSVANLLAQAGALRQAPLRTVDAGARTHDALPACPDQLPPGPDESYIGLIEQRYQLERELMDALAAGDKTRFQELYAKTSPLFDFSDRFPNQPVRALKNALIVWNTLLRKAAQSAGVPPAFLHLISEGFAIRIERCDRIDALNALTRAMNDEYGDLAVRHAGQAAQRYTPLVKRAVERLTVYFNRPLRLKELSRQLGAHPAHVSRQFRKETGMTLTEFQHKLRIDEAKSLLVKGREPIGRIAGWVGFEDAGHFTRLFKKREGMTPTEYRSTR